MADGSAAEVAETAASGEDAEAAEGAPPAEGASAAECAEAAEAGGAQVEARTSAVTEVCLDGSDSSPERPSLTLEANDEAVATEPATQNAPAAGGEAATPDAPQSSDPALAAPQMLQTYGRGFQILKNMGYREGKGLGVEGRQGIVAPLCADDFWASRKGGNHAGPVEVATATP